MARRKKRKKETREKSTPKRKPDIFNPAFNLKTFPREIKEETSVEKEKQEPPQTKKKPPDEDGLFLEAMSDVDPLPGGSNVITRIPNSDIRPAHEVRDDELEVMAHLTDLVSGNVEMDIRFSDEYIEGAVRGIDRKLLKKLKKGKFPIQDYIDLHGLNKQDAETRIREFLLHSQQLGMRCVLVVHGRGLNSENNIPILKECLPGWLTRGSAKRIVLAFSTARPYDGGTGAIYVLLRKPRTGL